MMPVTPSAVRGAVLIASLSCAVALGADKAGAGARYALDGAKSALEYQFVQAGAQNKGRFRKFQVTFEVSPDGAAPSLLDVVVDMTSLDTGDKERDDTLRSADLFDTAKFPQAHFAATQFTRTANGFDAVGKLTLRNVTRDVHVPFTFRTTDEQGKKVGYLTGKTTIKRLEFGVGQGDWKSTEWIGNDVTLNYSLRQLAAP